MVRLTLGRFTISMTLRALLLIAAILTTGLGAGVYFAFDVAVMPGLARVGDRTFVESVQGINIAIVRGLFMVVFLGALGFTVAAGLAHLRSSALPWIGVAALLSLAVLVVTFAASVPLNNAIDAADLATTDLAAVRERFESAWARWNVLRTVLSTAALGFLTWALLVTG